MFDIKNVNPSFFLRTYMSYNKIYKYKIRRICNC